MSAKEHSISLAAPMVRAILVGRKTQTRRILSPTWGEFGSAPREFWKHCNLEGARSDVGYLHVTGHDFRCERCIEMAWDDTVHRLYPRFKQGDRLWVRETWARLLDGDENDPDTVSTLEYKADSGAPFPGRWPEEFRDDMPRKFSRITLEVIGAKIERLWAISDKDCYAEGIEYVDRQPGFDCWCAPQGRDYYGTPRLAYEALWDSIHGPGAWDKNPWVVAITFKRV